MRRNEHVAGQFFQRFEAVAQIRHRVWILAAGAELEAGARDGVEAVRVDHVQAAGAVARLPRPAQATGRVARRGMCRQLDGADVEMAAVARQTHVLHGRVLGQRMVLRIIRPHFARRQVQRRRRAGGHQRIAAPLQFGQAARMVDVAVRIEDQLHVLDAKTQGGDIGDDLGRRFRQAAVDQHVALRRRHQHGTEAFHAHIIGIAEDAERRLVRIPGGADVAARRRRRGWRLRECQAAMACQQCQCQRACKSEGHCNPYPCCQGGVC